MEGESSFERDKRFAAELLQERQSWLADWRDLEQYFMPRRGRWLLTDHNRGGRRTKGLVNNTPIMALRALMAGMMSGMTTPSRPWFRLTVPDPALLDVGPVQIWLYYVEHVLRDILAKGNFYQSVPQVYRDLGCIGTAVMLVESDPETVVRFVPLPAGSFCLAVGATRKVDTIFREIPMNVRQVVEQFGYDRVSDQVKDAWKRKQYGVRVDVCHLVEPRLNRRPEAMDALNMRWRSVWWEKAGPNNPRNPYLRESGFPYFPVVAPRWDVVGDDVYGQSPAMECLGDAKAIQVQERRVAQAQDKLIDPPMKASSRVDRNKASLVAGSMTIVDDMLAGKDFTPAIEIDPNGIRFGQEDIARMEARVNHAMFRDLFQMYGVIDDRDRTAEEIRAREMERMLSLTPIIERLSEELNDPVITLTFRLAMEAGLLPPPPEELEGSPVKIEFISMLAQASKATATGSIERLVNFAGLLGQAQANAGVPPEVMDKLDHDQAFDEYAAALGVPPTIVRDDDAAAVIRQQRQQAQAAQQATAMTRELAAAAKDASAAMA